MVAGHVACISQLRLFLKIKNDQGSLFPRPRPPQLDFHFVLSSCRRTKEP
jgi:hypothetical protein